MGTPRPLTADTSIADWLADPVGNAILTDLLAQAGQTPDAFKPVRRFAIKRLVSLSRGAFTQEMLDEIVRRAQAGESPAGTIGSGADRAATAPVPDAPPTSPAPPPRGRSGWISDDSRGGPSSSPERARVSAAPRHRAWRARAGASSPPT